MITYGELYCEGGGTQHSGGCTGKNVCVCGIVGVRGGVFLQPPGVIRSISQIQIGKMHHVVGSNTHSQYRGLFRIF